MKIAFSTDEDALSKAIRIFTNCQWHHVAAVFDDHVIEARFTGVVKTPLEEFKRRGDYHIVDCPLEDEVKALEFAERQLGKKYDLTGLISFPFRMRWQHHSKWYCSELVAAIANAGGTRLVRADLNGVSPRDLWVASND